MTSSIIKIALMFFLSNRTCRTGLSRFGKLTFPKSAETKLLLTLYRIFGICSPCLILSIFRQVYSHIGFAEYVPTHKIGHPCKQRIWIPIIDFGKTQKTVNDYSIIDLLELSYFNVDNSDFR